MPQPSSGSVPRPELVVDHPSTTGEGPLWHEETQSIHWVDISNGDLFQYTPETGRNEQLYSVRGMLGGYTIQTDGSLILFGDNGRISRLTGTVEDVIVESVPDMRGSRFNDVIADPEGRIFCGTMPLGDKPGRLYRLDPDGRLSLIFDDIAQANGMGFSPDLSTMYLTDSNSWRIYRMEYDQASGNVSNRTIAVQLANDGTVPDGMTVDTDGNIWSARWDGHALYKYSPDGDELGRIEFPVKKVSSVTFGGPDGDVAYVTTAGGNDRGPVEGVRAGSLFRVDLGVSGRAPFRSRIGES